MKKLLLLLPLLWIAKPSVGQNLFGPMLKNECSTVPDKNGCENSEYMRVIPYAINNTSFLVVTCDKKERILIKESAENSWKRLMLPESIFEKKGFNYFATVLLIQPEANNSSFYEITIRIEYSSDAKKTGYKELEPVTKKIIIDARYANQYYLV